MSPDTPDKEVSGDIDTSLSGVIMGLDSSLLVICWYPITNMSIFSVDFISKLKNFTLGDFNTIIVHVSDAFSILYLTAVTIGTIMIL